MRVSKSASSGIMKASRTSRGRQKKIVASRKKALVSLKMAKKTLTRIKADIKIAAKQFAAHMVKAEETFAKVEELGGESPHFPSDDWEDFSVSESEIVEFYETIESIEQSAK